MTLLKKDFANTWSSGNTDLISSKEQYITDGISTENPFCSFCGNEEAIRVVKRVWAGDHNVYPCICSDCIDKFSKEIKSIKK